MFVCVILTNRKGVGGGGRHPYLYFFFLQIKLEKQTDDEVSDLPEIVWLVGEKSKIGDTSDFRLCALPTILGHSAGKLLCSLLCMFTCYLLK